MATRCYFPETEAAAVSPTISSSDWGHIPGTPTRRRLRQRAADASTLTTTAYTPDAADHVSVSVNAHHRQYVSDPLCAQTISGTVTAQFQTLEAHANNNLQITVGIWLVSRDGTTLRSTLLAPVRSGTEPTTSLRNTSLTSQALTSQTAVDGDRLVLEIGLGGTPTATSGTQGHNGSIRWGGTASGGDLPVNETSALTTLRPWLEFSANLAFGLTLAADSYVVTGVATDRFTHSVPSPPGEYALTGTDATLTFGAAGGGAFSLVLAGDSYVVSGSTAGPLAGFQAAAAADSYVLVGVQVGLLAQYAVGAVGGSYAVLGDVVGFVVHSRLDAATSAVALTGSDVALRADWRATAAPDAYSLTGTDATLTYAPVGAFFLVLDEGTYSLTGTATDRFTHSVPVPPGVYDLTGSDATLAHGGTGQAFELAVAGDAYGVSGADLAGLAGWRGAVDAAAYTLDGVAVSVATGRLVSADGAAAAYLLEGQDADLAQAVGAFLVDAEAGLYQLWGDETALISNPGIGLDAGAYDVAGADADLSSAPVGTRRFGDDFVILRRRRRWL